MSEMSSFKRISCKIKDSYILDEFAMFTGIWLHMRSGQNASEARKLLKNSEFLNLVHEDLENFLSNYLTTLLSVISEQSGQRKI